MTPQWPKVVGWLAALALLVAYSCSERRAGRLDEQIMNLERQHRADSIVADSMGREARKAVLAADSARGAAQTQVRRSEALRRETEASNAQAGEARRRAEEVLDIHVRSADSLGVALHDLVLATRADSAVHARRESADSTTIAKLLVALQKDSLAIYGQEVQDTITGRWHHKAGLLDENKALTTRALSAEALNAEYKKRSGGGWRGQVIAAGITYGACRWVVRCQP